VPGPQHRMEALSTHSFVYDQRFAIVGSAVADYDPAYKRFFNNPQKTAPIIKNDVLIGRGASVMPGVTIETGAVIAANSVVSRDVPPYMIVAGNPATVVKSRFPAETVHALLTSRWWRYRFTDFKGMTLSDPDRFVQELEERQLED